MRSSLAMLAWMLVTLMFLYPALWAIMAGDWLLASGLVVAFFLLVRYWPVGKAGV